MSIERIHGSGALTLRARAARTPREHSSTSYAFEDDEFLPYWAELWPSGIALAEGGEIVSLPLAGLRVLELGCGLGLPALVRRPSRTPCRRDPVGRRGGAAAPRGNADGQRPAHRDGARWTGSAPRTGPARRSTSFWPRTSSTRNETPCPCSACSLRPSPTRAPCWSPIPGAATRRRSSTLPLQRGWTSVEPVAADGLSRAGGDLAGSAGSR